MSGWAGTRARLTIVDVVLAATALTILALLGQPFYKLLGEQQDVLGTDVVLLLQITIPGLVIAILIVIFRTAVTGVGSR